MDVNLLLVLIGAIVGMSVIFCVCFCIVYKICVAATDDNDSDKVHKIAAADMRTTKIGLSMNPRSLHEDNQQVRMRTRISKSAIFGSDQNLMDGDSMDNKSSTVPLQRPAR